MIREDGAWKINLDRRGPYEKNTPTPEPNSNIPREDFDLPSPELLRLHRACCVVANLSGAAEYLDVIMDCKGDDGPAVPSFGDLLDTKLESLQEVPVPTHYQAEANEFVPRMVMAF